MSKSVLEKVRGGLSKFLRMKLERDYQGEPQDPTPIAPPIGYRKQPSIFDQQRAMIRQELSRQAELKGMETFEESDDFDIGDDYDPTTPYEADFDPPTAEVQKAFEPAPYPHPPAPAGPPQPAAAPAAPPPTTEPPKAP